MRDEAEAAALRAAGLADRVVVADATDPLAVAAAVGTPADVTVVCVDVPGAEHGAVLATADGGTVVFFSMATSFSAAALGAEGMAADVTMLVGNGYTPGHADLALELYRATPGVRALIDPRVRGMNLLLTDVTVGDRPGRAVHVVDGRIAWLGRRRRRAGRRPRRSRGRGRCSRRPSSTRTCTPPRPAWRSAVSTSTRA